MNCFAQTPTFAALTGGIASSPLTSGNTQVAIFGFSASVSGGSITFKQFNIGSNSGTPNACFANGTLVRSPTSTYSAGTGTPIGNVAISATSSTTSFTTTGLSETVSSSTVYYFLVVDVVNTSSTSCQPFVNNMTLAIDVDNVSYSSVPVNTYNFFNLNTGTPYAVSVANTTTGLTSPATILTSGTTGLALFGFSMSTTSSAATFTTVKINSNISTIGNYFTNFKLYSNTSNTYSGSTLVATMTGSASGSYVTFSGTMVSSLTANTPTYYFLVADCSVTGSLPVNVQFNLQDGQSSAALTRSLPSAATFNDFTAFGNTYNINSASITVNSLLGGTTSGTLTANQTGVVLFGFSVQPSAAVTLSGFNINSTNTAATYFGNGQLYSCTTNNYSTGISTPVSGATVTFSGNYAVVTGISEAFTASQTKYYFLVADDISGAASSTIAFNFTSGQSSAAITQSSPIASSYNIFDISGNTLTLPSPTIIVNGANSASNGITQGSLTYGQTNIVLFGFSAQAFGGTASITEIGIQTSGGESNYFSNARIYRSTTSVYPGGTPLYTSSVVSGCNCGYFQASPISESITNGTTYYYWLVVDYTGAGSVPTTFSTDFSSSQGGGRYSLISNYGNVNYTVSGPSFSLANAEKWTGATDNDFTKAGNFLALNGGGGVVPGSTMMVYVPPVTNEPLITATTTIGGITFGSGTTSLTIASGKTLTVNTAIVVPASGTATIAGTSSSGTVTLASTATSSTGASSNLNLTGGVTLNNAGTFTTGTSSIINLNASTLSNTGTFTLASTSALNPGNAAIANTGTFTLLSDANGSATIGAIAGSMTGNYTVQRYLQGSSADLSKRGYRLLSSPVYVSGATPSPYTSAKVYDLNFLVSGSIVTGLNGSGNGFTSGTSTSAVASLYLFREDIVPSQSSFASGNFKSIAKLNNTPAYNFGINKKKTLTNIGDTTTYLPIGNGYLFFFRGNSTLNAGTTAGTKTTLPYNYPENTTLVQTGTLNTGNVTVQPWFATTNNTNLSYTTTIANAAVGSNIRGYNLVGNPYPSTINWEKFNRQGTLGQSSIYGANIPAAGTTATKIYIFNSTSKQYAVYTPHTTISSAADTTTTEFLGANSSDGVVSNMISSGEGFFIVATAANQSITFRESAKTTTQAATGNLAKIFAASVPVQSTVLPNPAIRIKLVMDSVNTDAIMITLNKKYSPNFSDDEDAIDFGGNGALVNLSAVSADNIDLAVDGLPPPSKTITQIVPLAVSATSSGNYTLKRDLIENMPVLYTIFLKDNFMKDSLDMQANTTYSFNIDNTNPATYGASRFQIVIGENPALALKLMNFSAVKVAGATQTNVSWAVQNEANYTMFYVQRSTDHGKTFQIIDSLQSTGIGAYSFMDNSPVKGEDQYRLQLKDINGTITYSTIVIVQFPDNSFNGLISNISIYPNPASDILNVSVLGNNASTATYSVSIINSDGSIVKKETESQSSWQNRISDLAPGIYILRVVNTTNQQIVGTNKFIKL